MNKKKIIINIKVIIVVFIFFIMVLSFFVGKTYSTFIFKTNNEKNIQFHIDELKYSIKINNINTNTISLVKGNSFVEINITSDNKISTYFKLSYLKDSNIDIYYFEKEPYGLINGNENKTIKLFIINKSNNIKNITFDISGGYITNRLDDIILKDNYIEINRKISIGDYIEYKVNGSNEYVIDKKYSGLNDKQTIYYVDTKYRIFNINNDGSIDIISDDSLYIDNNKNKLKLYGVKGYKYSTYILDLISKNIYGNNDNVINAKNISINDINTKLINKTKYITKDISIIDGYYPSNDNILEYQFGSINLKEKHYQMDITKYNYINENYYDLINNYEEYFLGDDYIVKNNLVHFGIYSLNTNYIKSNTLYYSNNESKVFELKIRPLITLSNKIILNIKDSKWIIE